MGAHSSVVGSSSAGRYKNCIGSNDLIKRAPPAESSVFALDGTMLHFLAEEALNADADFDPHEFIGDEIELDEKDEDGNPVVIEVTEAHIVVKLLPVLEWFDNVLNPVEYWTEVKVGFDDGPLKGAFGTGDILYHGEDCAGVVDWKFGDGVNVEAPDNDQLKFLLAAAIKLPWFSKGYDVFDAYIVQPVEGREEQLVSHAQFTRAELLQFERELVAAKLAKDAGDTTLTAGSWCKFCPAEVICPVHRDRAKTAMEQAPVSRGTLAAASKKKKQDKKFKEEYDHDALRESYLLAVEAAAWADAVKKRVKAEFDAARPISGLKRVVYQELRQFVDEKKVRGWLRRLGLKAADMNEPAVLKSPAQIEQHPLVGKQNMRTDLVKKIPKGYQIVPADDPRPAVDDGGDPQALSQALAASLTKKK